MTVTLQATRSVPKMDWQPAPVLEGKARAGTQSRNGKDPWQSIMDVVAGFSNLGDDWDGQGARGYSADMLTSAIGLAYLLRGNGLHAPARVVPGPDGTVLFEWQDPDGTYCEVEVTKPFHAEVMLVEPGQPAQHWTLPTDS